MDKVTLHILIENICFELTAIQDAICEIEHEIERICERELMEAEDKENESRL